MTKVDRVEDLPEWFSLENYQGCESFKAADWYAILYTRKCLFDWPESKEYVVHGITYLELVSTTRSPLNRALLARGCGITIPAPGATGEHTVSQELHPVRPVLGMDLHRQAFLDGLKLKDACNSEKATRWEKIAGGKDHFALNVFNESLRLAIELDSYTDQPPTPILQVDLSASDKDLRHSFAAWLKTARAGQSVRSRPIYSQWVKYGLLPYLDLLVWETETGNNIPDRVMSEAIGNSIRGEDNLRKTTKPLAKKLMRDLSGLRSLAAVEADA